MKTQTPIAIAIEKLKESANFINADDSREDKYYQSGLKEAIAVLIELLPQEKEMVEKAWDNGDFRQSTNMHINNSKTYFTENYTQQ